MPDEHDLDFEFTDGAIVNADPYGETQVVSPDVLDETAKEFQEMLADTLVLSPPKEQAIEAHACAL